jgi:hypothetical protein
MEPLLSKETTDAIRDYWGPSGNRFTRRAFLQQMVTGVLLLTSTAQEACEWALSTPAKDL